MKKSNLKTNLIKYLIIIDFNLFQKLYMGS